MACVGIAGKKKDGLRTDQELFDIIAGKAGTIPPGDAIDIRR
jgi:hypothetical protein